MEKEYPRKFQIGFQEGTCPLACKKCFAFGTDVRRKKEVRKMPMYSAKKLLDEISGLGNFATIQPHIFTEPFANLDLKEIIQYCGSKKLKMSIITNGIMLNDDWMDFLLQQDGQKITISFSLDAVKQETYEKVRGNYDLAQIERKIDFLMEHKANDNLSVGVNFTIEEDNEAETDIFLNKWKYKVDAVRLHRVIHKNKKISKTETSANEKECSQLNEVMVIDAGGEVRVCSIDAFGDSYLGNVFENGIFSVWNGQKMEQLRERIRLNKLEEQEFCFGCEACGYGGNYMYSEDSNFYIADNGYDIFYNHK